MSSPCGRHPVSEPAKPPLLHLDICIFRLLLSSLARYRMQTASTHSSKSERANRNAVRACNLKLDYHDQKEKRSYRLKDRRQLSLAASPFLLTTSLVTTTPSNVFPFSTLLTTSALRQNRSSSFLRGPLVGRVGGSPMIGRCFTRQLCLPSRCVIRLLHNERDMLGVMASHASSAATSKRRICPAICALQATRRRGRRLVLLQCVGIDRANGQAPAKQSLALASTLSAGTSLTAGSWSSLS